MSRRGQPSRSSIAEPKHAFCSRSLWRLAGGTDANLASTKTIGDNRQGRQPSADAGFAAGDAGCQPAVAAYNRCEIDRRFSRGGHGMITKFDSLFAGHVDIENVGYGGIPVNDRRYPNEHLATVFDKAQAMAQLMDRLGYNTFWMAEHHFQHEGYECIPNVLDDGAAPGPCDPANPHRLRLQHHPDVASPTTGRGLRHRRYPERRAHHLWRRPRLSHPRGRDLRRAIARPAGQPRAVRRAGRHHLQGVQQRNPSPIGASTTRCRRRCPIAATRSRS